MPQSGIAGGTIYPCRFVKLSSTDGKVLQCGAGERPIGISAMPTRRSQYVDSTGVAAISGEPITFYDLGEECSLELAETVVRGYPLKSDADGKAEYADTDKDIAGAIALANGTSGKLIPVKVQPVDVAV